MRFRGAIPVVALATMLLAGPATAATKDVTIKDFAFIKGTVTATIGSSVHWTNAGTHLHSTTGDLPLKAWSIDVPSGDDATRAFQQAGTFTYHCRIHTDMHGKVKVPTRTSPGHGTSATTFTVTVASVTAPAGFVYVIQRKAPGGSFGAWKTTTAKSVTFKSSTRGNWQFRSQLKKTSNGARSGFSPAASVLID